jgi:nitric-oxide synthase
MGMRIDTKVRSNPLRRRLRRLGPWERREEAVAFINLYHRELELGDRSRRARVREVVRSLARDGSYPHTPDELAFGARVAWRNHARCIGRLFWRSLEVFDCRGITDPEAMAGRIVEHMAFARGTGTIRSAISIFAPVRGDALPAYVESRQIAQYAGHTLEDGRILGDPITAEATRTALALGWHPPSAPGMFDLLPFAIRDTRDRRLLFELPSHAVQQVAIDHPAHPGLSQLGLHWYTVPCVSSMILSIGGIDYPCAPFNGFYMGTEIASRNFCDERRYDLFAPVAEALGIAREGPVWKDRVLTELNLAVLHSFRRDGVTIVDHHEASAQYMDFIQREAADGRIPSGNWSWIVPPQAGSACPVFHLAMRDRKMVPNYYDSRATDGDELAPRYEELKRNRWHSRWERLRRRFLSWRRRRD